jgi:acyl carrier protein
MAQHGNQRSMEQAMVDAVSETMAEAMPENRDRLPEVTMASRFDSDLGLDSLSRAELLVNVERTFGVQLPEQLLSEADTPGDILNEIMRLRGEEPNEADEGDRAKSEDTEAALDAGAANREHFTVPDFDTLQQALGWHARKHPDRTYLHWVKSYDDVQSLTFGDLHDGALRVANGLFQHDVDERDTVALMLPTSHDYFYGFFGALYANAIPVPLYPPARASEIEEHLKKQAAILNNARARVMITVPEAKKLAAVIKGLVPSLEHVLTLDEVWGNPLYRPAAGTKGDDIAFLQYTSGSTGDPKGVSLSHTNLFANISAGNEVLQVDQDDVFVSWLPLYHDMGLIGTCLSSLWYGMHLVILSPLLFLTRPHYWLWAIDRFGGTLSPSPNFGYELCLKRISDEDMEGLDLSTWRVAFNGAEAVSPDTVERFVERFRPWGFRAESMAPVYGLAENCVALTFPEKPREPVIDRVKRDPFQKEGKAEPASPDDKLALRFVSCGKAVPGHRIRIVDDDGQELGERQEGNLQFTGPSATRGYYRNEEKTDELFDGEWLNTGDRGYIADDELYLSGRNKDLIVRAGRNIYPGEIEEAVGELELIRPGCVAAFASGMGESEGERLIVVAETREKDQSKLDQVKDRIHRIAMDSLDIAVDEIVLVSPHTVPKTSSGKLRRNDCRLRYERGELEGSKEPVWRQLAWLAGGTWRQQAKRGLQSAGRWLYSAWAWLIMGTLAVPVWVLVNILPSLSLRWKVAHWGGRVLARLTGTRLKVDGAQRLGQLPEGCVIVATHSSYLDSLVLAAVTPLPMSFIAKAELMKVRGLKRFLTRLGIEPVERSDVQTGVSDSRRIAGSAEGRRLLFFPEGSFDAAPGLRPFQMGAFMTAAVLQEKVIPVAIRGTRRKLPADRWNPRPGLVHVIVGEPIEPAGDDWKSAVKLRDQARKTLLEASGEPDRLG